MADADEPETGAAFEEIARGVFADQGIVLSREFPVLVGAGSEQRKHKFDLGSDQPPILVECKAHTWTTGGHAPSAKLRVWNEVMHYFACAPAQYRKILLVPRGECRGESLAAHYMKRYGHLVPDDVEIWELDPVTNVAVASHGPRLAEPRQRPTADQEPS